MGVLSLVDAKVIERYAALYARWREAERLLSEHGQVMEVVLSDGSRVPRKNPAVAVAAELAGILGRLEGQLGMSPAARSGLLGQDPLPVDVQDDLARRYFRA
jgi:P27 family predicted phage terminase small subunit